LLEDALRPVPVLPKMNESNRIELIGSIAVSLQEYLDCERMVLRREEGEDIDLRLAYM